MTYHSQVCAGAILRGNFDLLLAAPCRFFQVPFLGRFLRGKGLPLCLYLQEPIRAFYEAMPDLPWIAPAAGAGGHSLLGRAKHFAWDQMRNQQIRMAARRELEDARAYDLVLVNSYFSRECIARVYGLDARVCYLGYDAATFRRLQPPPPKERFVIGLGSMQDRKGVDTAIKSLARLPSPRPPLVWVANWEDADYRRKMETLAARLKVDFQVRSHISDATLVELMNRASLMLYTSHLEPFGFAPIEANACGLPVVAVAEGGVRETIVDGVNGFLCDREPAALAEAMSRLLDDTPLASKLAAAGERMAAQRWSPEQGINHLETCLQTFLETKQALPSL